PPTQHIDLQIADLQELLLAQRSAAVEGAQAGHQLGKGKRLDQVIVGTQFQPLDAIGDIVAGSEEQYRRVGLPAQAAQHFPAVQCRHHHIQNDDVEGVLQRQVQAVEAVARQ